MKWNNKRSIAAILLIAAIVSPCISLLTTREMEVTSIDSVMSAHGVFDMIELTERHFGSWNGQEVEAESLALLTEEGNTTIKDSYFRGEFRLGSTYLFFLYVYAGVMRDNLTDSNRIRIAVEGGSTMTYRFATVNVTISLGMTETMVNFGGKAFLPASFILFVVITAVMLVLWGKFCYRIAPLKKE